MSRDRFVHTEWGEPWGQKPRRDFGYCDNGGRLSTREEVDVYKRLKAEGWTVRKHGWPDFLATRGNEVRLIEVKSNADQLSHRQGIVIDAFRRLGAAVEVEVVDNPYRRSTFHRGRKKMARSVGIVE